MRQSWKKIADRNVRHLWMCIECRMGFFISPKWYEINGTPVCEHCDQDMKYVRTEIKTSSKK